LCDYFPEVVLACRVGRKVIDVSTDVEAEPQERFRNESLVEEKILTRLKLRDPNGMVDLHEKYGYLIHSVILRIVRNHAAAEDLAQETLLRIWERIRTFDTERGRLSRWVLTIARNLAVDHLRSLRNKPDVLTLDDVNSENRRSAMDRETEIDSIIRRDQVDKVFSILSAKQREVLHLTHFEGLTNSEIATRLGRPLGTVKSLLRSASKATRCEEYQ
jgi:RNA polymerase sigma-70 factor (ECF subfamily)